MQVVPAWGREPAAANLLDVDQTFAEDLDALMHDSITAHEAVRGWEQACIREASRLQSQAAACTHIPANADFYSAQADAMWEEACTWKLVHCLFCSETPQIGPDPIPSAVASSKSPGQSAPLVHQLANCARHDSAQRRVAQVVSWTEGIARQVREGGGPSGQCPTQQGHYFGSVMLLWQETLMAVRRGDAPDLQLDPDASTRCGTHHLFDWSGAACM
jgi:hypothetical protein